MQAIGQFLIKYLGIPLLQKLAVFVMEYIKVKNEERKVINRVKEQIKKVKEASTPEELKESLRNLHI